MAANPGVITIEAAKNAVSNAKVKTATATGVVVVEAVTNAVTNSSY